MRKRATAQQRQSRREGSDSVSKVRPRPFSFLRTARERTASTSLVPVNPALRAMAQENTIRRLKLPGVVLHYACQSGWSGHSLHFNQFSIVVRINDLLASQFDASPSPRSSHLTEQNSSTLHLATASER